MQQAAQVASEADASDAVVAAQVTELEKQLKALSTTYSYTSGGATTPAADLGRAAADLAVARSGRGGGGSGAPVRATRSFGRGGGGGGGRSRDASPDRRTRSFATCSTSRPLTSRPARRIRTS